MKTVKKKLNEDQLKARRRNTQILKADILDLEMEIRDNEWMLENKVAENRIRRQLVIAKSKKENAEQNLKIAEKELRQGYVEMVETADSIPNGKN